MTKPKLLVQLHNAIRTRHYSYRTEQAYAHWVRAFIRFHGIRHPDELGEPEITAFLTHLAVDRGHAASTQNQALSALLFLYREVLDRDFPELKDVVRAQRPRRLPVVLSREETAHLLDQLAEPKVTDSFSILSRATEQCPTVLKSSNRRPYFDAGFE